MAGGGQGVGNGALGGVPRPNQFGWYKRRLPVLTPMPMPSNPGVVPLLPPAVLVVQQSRRIKSNRGAFFKPTLLRPPVVNVAGGVIRPWVARKDYERGGKFYPAIPVLKTSPPPVAGGVPPSWVRRWDFERAGLFYRERNFFVVPLVVPPPPPTLVDGAIWYAPGRDNEWDSDHRLITWSADVATFLTKRSGETRLYAMDFSALPELQNANLAGVASVTATPLTVGASNVTLTNPALGSNGKTAVVWIAGGVSGASYKITFTVTVAGGTTLEDFGYLLVEDE
jgi:hypothetical protein